MKWIWPVGAKREHCFQDDGKSLCGRWAILTIQKDEKFPSIPSKRACQDCKKAWRKKGGE